jgi:hypothetical protein
VQAARWVNPTYEGIARLPAFSFDNVAEAFLTISEVINIEGFTDVMSAAMDVTSKERQPSRNAAAANAAFFVVVIVIGTFFVSNLYAGVIVQSFSRSGGTAFLKPEQREWLYTKRKVRARLQIRVC